MKLDDTLYNLYQSMYDLEFKRTLLIGTNEKGYDSYFISNLDELCELFEDKSSDNEIYMSIYDFDTDERINQWNNTETYKFIEKSRKNCIVLRFRENFDIIKEETKQLNDVQKFMFIRRSINLGFNTEIMEEAKKTYEYIKEEFGIKAFVLFNGLNECSLYIYTDELELKYPSEVFYTYLNFLEKELNLKTLTYKNIEIFSQVISLPGSQNNYSKLYNKPYDINWEYEQIIKNATDRKMNDILPDKNQDTSKLSELFTKIDEAIAVQISKHKSINVDVKNL